MGAATGEGRLEEVPAEDPGADDPAADPAAKGMRQETVVMVVVVLAILAVGAFIVWRESGRRPGAPGPAVEQPAIGDDMRRVPPELVTHERVDRFATGFAKEVWGIELLPEGRIAACGEDGIRIFTRGGRERDFWPTDDYVRAVSLGPDDRVYACIRDRVVIYDLDGAVRGEWDTFPEHADCNEIVFGGGHAFVVDRSLRQMYRIDPATGEITMTFAGLKENRETGLSIPGHWADLEFHDGRVYVTNPHRMAVQAYDPETGGLVDTVGEAGFGHDQFAPCCNPVAMTIHPDGRILTSEKGIQRTKTLSPRGDLLGVVAIPQEFEDRDVMYAIDLEIDDSGRIYALTNGTNEIFVYESRSSAYRNGEAALEPADASAHGPSEEKEQP